jgi:hypothetical protein
MTLQDWGALGELVGGAGIIVSLVYVGLQIRQGTKASRSATNQAFSAQYAELILQITREDFRDVFWRGIGGLENLQGSEKAAFMGWHAATLRTFESFYFQLIDGSFDSRLFDAWIAQWMDLIANQGPREYWELRKHQFSTEFAEYMEQQIANATPKSMYPGSA